ncbi:zinc finger, CCHC-type containing protein [Tanacetum coccineum]|uniref:Zinc finger, CCHC-type containing protein n=1 Tax=Tanacetum coccineum TaxID=301880 RepID=A0ABQ5E7R8_9ASTR
MDQSAGLRMFGSDTIKLDRMDGINFTRSKEKMKFLLTALKDLFSFGLQTFQSSAKSTITIHFSRSKLPSNPSHSTVTYPTIGAAPHHHRLTSYENPSTTATYHHRSYATRPPKQRPEQTPQWYECSRMPDDQIQQLVAETLAVVGLKTGVLNAEEQRKCDQDETLCRGYILSTLIDRLKKLMHTSEDFTLDQIQKHLRIEEETRIHEKNMNGASILRLIMLIQEPHMASVTTTTNDWWYDFVATTHVCNNRGLFKTYKETEDGHEAMMHDNHTSQETTMKDMLTQGIISYNGEHKDKCEICVQAKMKRKPFPKVDRQSEILELVHSDICELNGHLTRGGNSANLPKNLWGKALLTACHGYLAYYKVPLPNTSKLGPRGLKSVFVRYEKDSKSYRCLDLDSNIIVESRDVNFFENKFCHDSTSTNEIVTPIPQDISSPDLNSFNKRNMAESSNAPRRRERARKERNLDPDFIDSQAIIFLVEGDNKNNIVNKIPVLLNVEDAPKTYKKAITSRNYAFWKEAIDDKMDSLFTKDHGVILCLYVDDILIVGTNMEGINETKKFLSSCFQMKDMYEVDTILGIKVKRHSGDYALNQCHYIDKIIDKFQHLNIEEANTPYESSCKLFENNGRAVAQIKYASAKAAGKEAEWLRNTLLDKELQPQPMLAISLHCDSQSCAEEALRMLQETQFGDKPSDFHGVVVVQSKASIMVDIMGMDNDMKPVDMHQLFKILLCTVEATQHDMDKKHDNGLPPGSLGLPVIRRSLGLLKALKANRVDDWFQERIAKHDETKFDGGVIRAPPLSTPPLPSTTVEHHRYCIHTSFTNWQKGSRLASGSYCTVHEGFTE